MYQSVTRIVLILGTLLPLWGQQQSSVRIYTEPAGAKFSVDGTVYSAAAEFFWTAGSKHTLSMEPMQVSLDGGTRQIFRSWADSTGILNVTTPTVAVTANPSVSYIKAIVELDYAILLNFGTGGGPPPGTVYIADLPFQSNATVWATAGSLVKLQAIPNPGFVFAGWSSNAVTSEPFVQSFVINGPVFLSPLFQSAGQITFQTSPAGLTVLADSVPVATPATLEWGLGSQHTIGVTSPQNDTQGRAWIFDSWSVGPLQTQTFTMPATNAPQTVTARFNAAVVASFLTDPDGLKLTIDGRDNWPSYNFDWAAGSQHSVSAPSQQVDAAGRTYVFRAWSNGGPASQNITAPTGGLRMVASYDALGQLTVNSSPPAMTVQLDGTNCQTPCTVQRALGAKVALTAPPTVATGADSRLDFRSWSDGGAIGHTWVSVSDPQTLTVTYHASYRLSAVADPAGAASFRFQPSSADGFYPSGTQVTVFADPNSGYTFRYWDGPNVVTMNGPAAVRALMAALPQLATAVVQNAAGDVPAGGVAPGSIISIYGANLAPDTEAGPVNPLAQTIAGVTVQLNDRILPLFFVSPGQINALLVSDLAVGDYTLTVHWTQHPDVTAPVHVVRNAPGLFTAVRTGDSVVLDGTGFGPYLDHAPRRLSHPRFRGFAACRSRGGPSRRCYHSAPLGRRRKGTQRSDCRPFPAPRRPGRRLHGQSPCQRPGEQHGGALRKQPVVVIPAMLHSCVQ